MLLMLAAFNYKVHCETKRLSQQKKWGMKLFKIPKVDYDIVRKYNQG